MTLKELMEARAQALTEARSYVDKKEETAEDQANYDKDLAEFRRLERLIADETAFLKAEAEAAEARAQFAEIVTPKVAAKAIEKQADEAREFVTYGSDRRSLWIPYGETRTTGTIVTDDGGAGAYGSYATPTTWWPQLYYHVNAVSGVLASNVTVIRTASGEQIDIPTLSTDAAATQTAQGSAATESIPVFGQKVLNAYRQDMFVSVSKEFLEDSAIDAVGTVQTLILRAIATQLAALAAAGTGSSAPQGLNYTTEPTTAGKTAASATTWTLDELMDLYLSVAPASRKVGEFVMGTSSYGIFLKTKNDEGSYMVQAPTATESATFMGRPVREDAGYQATTSALCPVTFGDMSAFWTRYSRGMELTRDDSFAFTSFKSTFRAAVWFDSDLMDTLAVKHLLMAT
jgi:HK97 family phage major capsid protein